MEEKENIKELFFNYSTRHWHFEELLKESGLSRAQTNEWLKRLIKQRLIKKVKKIGKMPYYIANHKSVKFNTLKKIYALRKFEKTGFLEHLSSLKKAKTVTLFGSFARSDWHNESDIDLFIYGSASDFKKGYYETKLNREIQLFNYNNKKELKRLRPEVLSNIASGIHIKGGIDPFKIKL